MATSTSNAPALPSMWAPTPRGGHPEVETQRTASPPAATLAALPCCGAGPRPDTAGRCENTHPATVFDVVSPTGRQGCLSRVGSTKRGRDGGAHGETDAAAAVVWRGAADRGVHPGGGRHGGTGIRRRPPGRAGCQRRRDPAGP